MRKLNILFALTAVVLILLMTAVTAYSAEIDTEKIGSVTFTIRYADGAVSGGNIRMCRIATLESDDDDLYYAFVPALADSGLDINEPSEWKFAQSAYEAVTEKELDNTEKTVGTDGKVSFDDLRTGVYLFYQTEPAEGFDTLRPFVASVPLYQDGEYVYDIDASPKPRLLTKATTDEPPKQDEKLPQTGQLKWPIPGLFLYGLFFVLIGIYIVTDTREA